jgi:uncharacterized protein involved in exopolysaccharide biosynthesis
MQNTNQAEQSKHLTEYYFILAKRKWIILVACFIAVGLAIYHNSRLHPVYRTTATIVIENNTNKSPITGQALNYESYYSGTISFNTHLKLITSRPVLERVAKALKLDQIEKAEFVQKNPPKTLLSHFKNNISLLLGNKENSSATVKKAPQLVSAMRGKIKIEHVEDTRLLKISVTDKAEILPEYIELDDRSAV